MKQIHFVTLAVSLTFWALPAVYAAEALVNITGTSANSPVKGTVKLTDGEGGVTVEAAVEGLTPGKHGFHVHEFGNCAEEGKAAGGHYNPMGVQHGFLAKDGKEHAHAGDLGNIEAGADGKGTLKGFLPGVNVSGGEFSLAGRAVIVHEKEDDFGQRTGNAGGRIGCGLIAVTGR